MKKNIITFIKFGIVGFSNTIIGYLINVIALIVMKPMNFSKDYIVANVISFILSVLWSFFWNNKFVFKVEEGQERSAVKTLLKTYVSYGFTGIILNNILSFVWVDMLGVSKFFAPLINLFISVPVNFILNKMWAFRTKSK